MLGTIFQVSAERPLPSSTPLRTANDNPSGMGSEKLLARGLQSDPKDWFGPFYISAVIDSLSLGILCGQVWTYYSSFSKDPIWVRRVVDIALGLSILKAFQSFYLVWEKGILGFGDWERAFELDWAFCMSPCIATAVALSAQVYFVWRCYALTGRNRTFLVILIAIMLTALILLVGLFAQFVSNPHDEAAVRVWALPLFVVFIVLDSVITLTVSYKLLTSRSGDNRNTDSVLAKIVAVTWESALPPTLVQITAIGVQFTKTPRAPTWNFVVGELAARLYAFSLMYSLNSRLRIRELSRAVQSDDLPARWSATELSEVRFQSEGGSNMIYTFDSGDQKGHVGQGWEDPASASGPREIPPRPSGTTAPRAVSPVDRGPPHMPLDPLIKVLHLNGR